MLYCPRNDCHRAGPDVGTCADRQVIGCPAPKELDTKTHVVVRCTLCDKTRAISIDAMMHGRLENQCSGEVDRCRAVLLKVPSKGN